MVNPSKLITASPSTVRVCCITSAKLSKGPPTNLITSMLEKYVITSLPRVFAKSSVMISKRKGVRARPAGQRVIVPAAVQNVVPVAALEHIIAVVAGERVVPASP